MAWDHVLRAVHRATRRWWQHLISSISNSRTIANVAQGTFRLYDATFRDAWRGLLPVFSIIKLGWWWGHRLARSQAYYQPPAGCWRMPPMST